MKRNLAIGAILVVTLLAFTGTLLARRTSRVADAPSVELGRHLVSSIGCNDCHTPFKMGPNGPEPDMTRMLSGHPQDLVLPDPPQLGAGPWTWVGAATNTAYAGPWGVTFAPNLTPDVNTGLGIWTEEMFVQAIRTGRHMGQSRTIQPPMPWQAFANMTDRELKSIYAYLRTVPPIENLAPEYRPPMAADEDPMWSSN